MPDGTDVVEFVAGAAAGAAVGNAINSPANLPYYNADNKEKYEALIEHFCDVFEQQIPAAWSVERKGIEPNEQIRPSRRVTLAGESGKLAQYKNTIKKFKRKTAENKLNPYKEQILRHVVAYLEQVIDRTKKYKKAADYWYQWTYFFSEERIDSPDVLLVTEFADFIEASELEEIKDQILKKRIYYCTSIMVMKQFQQSSVKDTLNSIHKYLEEMSKILPEMEREIRMPDLLEQLNNYILYDVKKVFDLIYKCCTGAKSDFNITAYRRSEINEHVRIRESIIGCFVLEIFRRLDLGAGFSTDRLTVDDLTSEFALINDTIHAIQQTSMTRPLGLLEIFANDEQKAHAAGMVLNVLKDAFELFFYTKNINLLKNVIRDQGIHTFLDENVILLMNQHFSLIESLKIRLVTRISEVRDWMVERMNAHAASRNTTTENTFYRNLNNGITNYNDKVNNQEDFSTVKATIFNMLTDMRVNQEEIGRANKMRIYNFFMAVWQSYQFNYNFEGLIAAPEMLQLCERIIGDLNSPTPDLHPELDVPRLTLNGEPVDPAKDTGLFVNEMIKILDGLLFYDPVGELPQINYLNELFIPLGDFSYQVDYADWRSSFFRTACRDQDIQVIHFYDEFIRLVQFIDKNPALLPIGLNILEHGVRYYIEQKLTAIETVIPAAVKSEISTLQNLSFLYNGSRSIEVMNANGQTMSICRTSLFLDAMPPTQQTQILGDIVEQAQADLLEQAQA